MHEYISKFLNICWKLLIVSKGFVNLRFSFSQLDKLLTKPLKKIINFRECLTCTDEQFTTGGLKAMNMMVQYVIYFNQVEKLHFEVSKPDLKCMPCLKNQVPMFLDNCVGCLIKCHLKLVLYLLIDSMKCHALLLPNRHIFSLKKKWNCIWYDTRVYE